MKKVKNFVIIFTLLIIRFNTNYATVTGNYTVSKTKSNGKMLFLLIGFLLISMVLFLGYKMDKLEETNSRKKKYNKTGEDNSIKSRVSNWISKIRTKEDIEKKELFVYDELSNKEESSNNIIGADRDIIEFDEDDLNSVDNSEIIVDENESNNTEEVLEEPKIQNKELDMISSIFNTDELNMKVKGYDYDSEDDIDLLDIEASIKEANIKRYTRKKEKKATKSVTKHYTRKIEKNIDNEENEIKIEEKKEKKPKKYTRKIKNEETEDKTLEKPAQESEDNSEDIDFLSKIIDLGVLDEIEDLEKTKTIDVNKDENEVKNEVKNDKEEKKARKGRKTKTENADNKETKIAKSKRGRKPKVEKNSSKKEDKPKVIKEKKTKTKKDNEKPKRGRKPKVITQEEELRQAIEMLPKSRRGRKSKN